MRRCRCWALLKTGMSPEDILMEEEAMLQGMRADFQALDRVHAAHKATTLAFPADADIKEMSPEAAQDAIVAESEAAESAQVGGSPCSACRSLLDRCKEGVNMPAKHSMKSVNSNARPCPVQAARVSADAVAAAVTLTNDCIKDGNAVEATSKAAASAWRSSQVSSLLLLLWPADLLCRKDWYR